MDTEDVPMGILALGRWVLGAPEYLPIDETRHQRLRTAMEGVLKVLGFEDKFTMIMDNFIELEFALLRLSALNLLRPQNAHDSFFDQKREINRHLTNLLSTCRQYIDQNDKHIRPYLSPTNYSLQEIKSAEYDQSLAYRTMEWLRNYVQHRDLGVHTLSVEGGWIDWDDDEKKRMRYNSRALLDLKYLENAGDLTRKDQKLIAELKSLPHQPDILWLARAYISGLSRIHVSIRKALLQQVADWKRDIRASLSEYKTTFPEIDVHGLVVKIRNSDGTGTRLLDVWEEPVNRLERMEQLNFCHPNLQRCFITSEFVPKAWQKD